jgi:tetratricopeptide (TPR) repeat protein
MRTALALSIFVCAVAGTTTAPAVERGDPLAAEREFRVARRLAAEGSPQAAAALRRVFELDPSGPLADDALLEQALLSPVAGWPDELGGLDMVAAPGVRSLIDRVLSEFPDGDRALEARYRRGLLRFEPVPGHDAAAGRAELIVAATADNPGPWSSRARFALAWLLERDGQYERAAEAYTRIVVDRPRSDAAGRAQMALGRLALRDERYGEAARWLEEAIDEGLRGDTLAPALRECAARRLFGGAGDPRRGETTLAAGARSVSGMAATPEGELLLADRREGKVRAFRDDGSLIAEWSLEDPGLLLVDEAGRAHVAAGGALYRLAPGGMRVHAASLGDYAPPTAVTAGRGGFWVLDKRGQRIGRIQPGAPAPLELWSGRGSKLVALVWDGRRLLALDSRTRTLIAITAAGIPRTLATLDLDRPTELAVDASGRISVLDPRAGQVRILDSRGAELDRFGAESQRVERLTALASGVDGMLHLFDESSGKWVRIP